MNKRHLDHKLKDNEWKMTEHNSEHKYDEGRVSSTIKRTKENEHHSEHERMRTKENDHHNMTRNTIISMSVG